MKAKSLIAYLKLMLLTTVTQKHLADLPTMQCYLIKAVS
jgi:hypothetical protein